MGLDDGSQALGGAVNGLGPTHGPRGTAPGVTHLGLQQARAVLGGATGAEVQGAALGAQSSPVGRVVGVTTHAGDLGACGFDQHPTAHAAVGAGGSCQARCGVGRDAGQRWACTVQRHSGRGAVGAFMACAQATQVLAGVAPWVASAAGLASHVARRPGQRSRQVSGVVCQFAALELHLPVLHAHVKRRGTAHIGLNHLPVSQADAPVVQRAGHMRACHDALAQRPAFVRAAVEQRVDRVRFGAKQGHVQPLRALHPAGAQLGDVGDGANSNPVVHNCYSFRSF
ncbi:MAG: hypothetical protein OHK0048_17720 [Rhodoferax sp.]